MDILDVFSKNVKEYRKILNMSQAELADLAGLHRTYISAVEHGRRSISLDNIQRIADALKIDTYQLFIEDTQAPVSLEVHGSSDTAASQERRLHTYGTYGQQPKT